MSTVVAQTGHNEYIQKENLLGDIEDEFKNKLGLSSPEASNSIIDTAIEIAGDYPGEYNINQVCEIYKCLRERWYYFPEKPGREYVRAPNVTLNLGKTKKTIGAGDCDDFAVLMACLVESLGGSARVVIAIDKNQKDENHAYA